MIRPATALAPVGLIRGIGFIGIVLIALNSVIGAGIFALPAEVAASVGPWSHWLFLVCGLLIITVVLTYAELASYFKESGGPVLYTTVAFGPIAGFTSGWMLFTSRITAFAANSTVMAVYIGAIWPWFATGIGRATVIVLVCASLTLANVRGVKDGVYAIGLFTFFKIVPLLLLILLGLPHVGADTLFPSILPQPDVIGSTTLLLIYAFVGFEATTIIAGETMSPKSDLPRALILSIIGIAGLYFLVVLIYLATPTDAGEGKRTLVDVGRTLAGPAGAVAITVAAVFSIGGNLASMMLTVPRLAYTLARQGLLPEWFGFVHRRHATPANSILFMGMVSLAFALSGSFAWLAAASALTRLIVYVLCILALPVIRRRASEDSRREALRLKGSYAIPFIALALCIWIAAQSTQKSWLVTGGLLLSGLAFYRLAKQKQTTLHHIEAQNVSIANSQAGSRH